MYACTTLVHQDHRLSTLSGMSGGQLVLVPECIARPPRVPVLMWQQLQREHNTNQLFAIVTVTAPPPESQDTQVHHFSLLHLCVITAFIK